MKGQQAKECRRPLEVEKQQPTRNKEAKSYSNGVALKSVINLDKQEHRFLLRSALIAFVIKLIIVCQFILFDICVIY